MAYAKEEKAVEHVTITLFNKCDSVIFTFIIFYC